MGKQWKQCQTFIFRGSKITADGDCGYEIKRRLLLGRKVMTNLDSTLKSRDITLSTKVRLIKAMVFPVVMYGCESWTTKKAEHQRTDAFELMLEKTLESPLDSKEIQSVHPKGDQSWVFIGRTDVVAETPILWPPDAKNDSFEKTLMLGKTEGRRRRGQQRMEMAGWHHWLNGHEFWWTPGVGDGTGRPGMLRFMGSQRLNWTEQLETQNRELVLFTWKMPVPIPYR